MLVDSRMHLLLLFVVLLACPSVVTGQEARWWKGNTHTHTLWSDGNAAPEQVADWYRKNGYHFLVLSDHNILSTGEKWFPIGEMERSRLTSAGVESLRDRFGEDWLSLREVSGKREMRLKTLDELRAFFELPGEFLFIQGEEITDRWKKKEVHINGLNLTELIEPQHGDSVREVIQRNVDAVVDQGKRTGRPVLAHLNHPNFRKSLTPEDVASIENDRFFEVYNGHRSVLNHGDGEVASTEVIWDVALTLRLTRLQYGLLYGLATDDSHDHHGLKETSTPGRGWIFVRSEKLEPNALIQAMRKGDFYASNGVVLEDFGRTKNSLWLSMKPEPGVTYKTEFIGTRLQEGGVGEIGEIFKVEAGVRAEYRFEGNELYVRARVVSSRPHPNPFATGDMESAWVQPILRSD